MCVCVCVCECKIPADPELSIVERALLIEIVIMKLKFRYYFIWMLCESVVHAHIWHTMHECFL